MPPIVHEVLRSPGQPLDAETRAFMEPRFGHDFSRVRVHTDARAAESARAVNALAYTVGRDVVFGAGQYAPGASAGRRLLAHELAHVVQQGDLKLDFPQHRLIVSIGDQASEIEADRASSLVVSDRLACAEPYLSISVGRMAMLQRQEVCQPEGENVSQSSADVIYDYEDQVCRLPYPEEIGISVPHIDEIDGEFWIWPSGLRRGATPIFDDHDTSVIVGFRYSSGGYYEIYDLEGNMVESGEPGLESPLIDPIDLLAGGITGLGRGLLRGGVRAVGRGVASSVGRGGGTALARAGLVVTIRALSARAITAIRGTYRAIRFRGALNFTGTTAARMADPARRVPHHILKLAIRFGTRSPDPQGVVGAFRYTIPMIRNGRQYTLEVVIRESDRTVLHFLYR
ncbi:MAG: DUF4157 domain-containing protein [Chloroflexaceae bacterium]